MLNIQSVKEIETLCAKIASRNNISFHDAFECLSEEQQAVYDEYMTRQYKNKLNNMFGADWIKKASPVMLYNVSLKNYKKDIKKPLPQRGFFLFRLYFLRLLF